MKKRLPAFWLTIGLFHYGYVSAQHLAVAQILELFNAPTDRRGTILTANGFTYQGTYKVANTPCFRYSRMQADVFGDEFEETVSYCASGSLTYVTFSPDHGMNLKIQLVRKFDFQDRGAFATSAGLLKNLYQRRTLKVETANTKDSRRQDMWLFQLYEEGPASTPQSEPVLAADKKSDASAEKDGRPGRIALKGNFYALIIGVNEYADRQLPDLTFPIQDGAKLKKVLTDQYTFTERNISRIKQSYPESDFAGF